MPESPAHGIIKAEKRRDVGIKLNYGDDKNSQGYGDFVSILRHSTKDTILSLHIAQSDFRSDNGNNLYDFDLRYHKGNTHIRQ